MGKSALQSIAVAVCLRRRSEQGLAESSTQFGPGLTNTRIANHPPVTARLTRLTGSLKLRITLASTVSLAVVLAVVMAVLVSRVGQTTLENSQRREQDEAARMALVLSRVVHDLRRSLEVVGKQLDRGILSREAELNRLIEARPVLRGLFSNVYVASAEGRLLSYFDDAGMRSLDFNLMGRAYFERTVKERRAVISDPVPGRLTGTPVIVLTYPLQDSLGVYGVIAGGLRLTSRDLLAGLVDTKTSDRDALIVVTDRRGVVIAHPHRDRLMKTLADEPRLSGAFAVWSKAGSQVSARTLSDGQPGEVVSTAVVDEADWIIWRTRSAKELLAPARGAQQEAIRWSVILVVAMSFITAALLTWLLKPLQMLTIRSQHIFDGSVAAGQGWPKAAGEIGRLADVLQRASEDRAKLEGRNTELLKQLTSVMASSPVGIAITRHQQFELVSTEFCRQLGRAESELLHAPARIIYANPDDYATLGAQVGAAFKAAQPFVGVLHMVRGDGSTFWGRLSGNPVDPMDPTAGTIWCLTDVTSEKTAHEELEWTATHDALTGLLNRRAFMAQAERLVADHPKSLPSTLIAIDLDHFKPINDLGGHAAGDAMLRAVASAMQHSVRANDVVARVGGDEFAVLLAGCDRTAATRVAQSLLAAIAEVGLDWEGQTFKVSGSIGAAGLYEHSDSLKAWLERADAASYAAKAAGRGCVKLAPIESV